MATSTQGRGTISCLLAAAVYLHSRRRPSADVTSDRGMRDRRIVESVLYMPSYREDVLMRTDGYFMNRALSSI